MFEMAEKSVMVRIYRMSREVVTIVGVRVEILHQLQLPTAFGHSQGIVTRSELHIGAEGVKSLRTKGGSRLIVVVVIDYFSNVTHIVHYEESLGSWGKTVTKPMDCWVGLKAIAASQQRVERRGDIVVGYDMIEMGRTLDKGRPYDKRDMVARKLVATLMTGGVIASDDKDSIPKVWTAAVGLEETADTVVGKESGREGSGDQGCACRQISRTALIFGLKCLVGKTQVVVHGEGGNE